MNYKMIGRILSWILLLEAAFMTPALVISACLGELEAVHAFALSMGLTLARRWCCTWSAVARAWGCLRAMDWCAWAWAG